MEIGLDLLHANRLTESLLEVSIRKNPNAKPSILKIYKEILCNDNSSSCSIKILLFDLISNAIAEIKINQCGGTHTRVDE